MSSDREEQSFIRTILENQLFSWPYVTSKYMFGCFVYLVKGKLFAFINDDDLVITNLDETSREAITESLEAFPFESKGKFIGGWIEVVVSDESELTSVIEYVRKSYEAALAKPQVMKRKGK